MPVCPAGRIESAARIGSAERTEKERRPPPRMQAPHGLAVTAELRDGKLEVSRRGGQGEHLAGPPACVDRLVEMNALRKLFDSRLN